MGNKWKILVALSYFLIFCVVSKILFINIYDIGGLIVDELFHIPQGLNYCDFNFTRWDPKITTLPGLYIVSTIMMAPIGFCSVYGMRLTNLIAAFVNIPLFISLFHLELDANKRVSWSAILSGFSLGILPPLYFFSHLYYTDTLSVTSILLMLLFSKTNHCFSAVLAGASSIIIRQTNVIWLAMVFGQIFLNLFMKVTNKPKNHNKKLPEKDDFWRFYSSVRNFVKGDFDMKRLTFKDYKTMALYLIILLAFVIFVVLNGSIVVGDKKAHTALLHLPQLFYFSIFCLVFALPHMCLEVMSFIKFIFRNFFVTFAVIILGISIVHYNTLVHPYLLADNRHYTFYVWKRIYERYFYSRYALVFVYTFAIYAILQRTDAIKKFSFWITFIPGLVLVLALQKLVDVRYFLIPFIVLRLKFKSDNFLILIFEHILYLAINYITLSIFFRKEIMWDNFSEPQRLSW